MLNGVVRSPGLATGAAFASVLLAGGCAALVGADFDRTNGDADHADATDGTSTDGASSIDAPAMTATTDAPFRVVDDASTNACASECGSPPPAACADGTTLRTYAAAACVDGGCSYAPSATTCTAPVGGRGICTSGACTFTCVAGYKKSGASCVPLGPPSWTTEALSSANELHSVWGSGESDVYVASDFGTVFHSVGTGSWQSQSTDDADLPTLYAVTGFDAAHVSVGGASGSFYQSTGNGAWSLRASGSSNGIGGLWMPSATTTYIASGGPAGTPLWKSTSSTTLTPVCSPAAALNAIWGTDEMNIYTVGQTTTGDATVLHLAGSMPSCAPQVLIRADAGSYDFTGVWGSSANDVYIVGSGGTIFHSPGTDVWTRETSGTTKDLDAVWGSSASDVYAVGADGTILHSTGNGAWTSETSGTSVRLNGIWGSSDSDVYIVGAGGVIVHGP